MSQLLKSAGNWIVTGALVGALYMGSVLLFDKNAKEMTAPEKADTEIIVPDQIRFEKNAADMTFKEKADAVFTGLMWGGLLGALSLVGCRAQRWLLRP